MLGGYVSGLDRRYKLLQLRCGLCSGLDGRYELFFMYHGNILRWRSNCMYGLLEWYLPGLKRRN